MALSLSLQLGFPDVPKSITNPSVDRHNALDVASPMSFLQFIKLIIVSFDPDTLQNYYNTYVKSWNSLNLSKKVNEQDLIIEKYREFIQDIIIQYSTLEEKKFLSNVDFNDPLDLDVILGFYSKKLIDLCSYYNERRSTIKFSNIRNKLIGSNYGSIKTIYDLSLAYLKTLDDSKMLIDFDEVLTKFSVDIDELYDTYPTYFDQPSNDTINDNKDLDYGLNIFLRDDVDLIEDVFSGFSDTLKSIKEVDLLFENKRKLTEKYLYTDYYFLSTGSSVTDILSGKLFEVDNGILNFVNRYHPTTASTGQTEYFTTHRDHGFFRPSKVSIVVLDGLQKNFEFNYDNLLPNSLYFFPDPSIIGVNGDVLIFNVDDAYLKKNASSGNAINEPTTSEYDSKYYGYVSKIDLNYNKYLDSMSNFGIISDSKCDVYGNLYGLFKNSDDHGVIYSPESINVDISSTIKSNIIFDGYKFYDDLYNSGFSFDYDIEDYSTYSEIVRTGVTVSGYNLSSIATDTLFFGKFGSFAGAEFIQYPQPITPTSDELVTIYEILEGGFITTPTNDIYPDAISSDLSAFEMSVGTFYYTDLIEGGIYNTTQRALLDPLYPQLSATFIDYDRDIINYVDGEKFGVPFDTSVDYYSEYAYDDSFVEYTELSPLEKFQEGSVLMIRNNTTRTIAPLLDSLEFLNSRYSEYIKSELETSINRFEIVNDILMIETDNYLTFDKIIYSNGVYADPKTSLNYITHNQNDFDHISNRLKVDNIITYCKIAYIPGQSPTDFYVYPIIYKFNPANLSNNIIYTRTPENITDFFGVSGGDIRYITASDVILTHNSKNDVYSISYLLKDQNFVAQLHTLDYYLAPDPTFITKKSYNFGGVSFTSIFDNIIPINIKSTLSQSVSYLDTELIL